MNARIDDEPRPAYSSWAWNLAGATAILEALIAAGAVASDAPGDRQGGITLWFVVASGVLALLVFRRNVGALAWATAVVALVQAAAAAIMLTAMWGVPAIVVVVNALPFLGWSGAAALFRFAAVRAAEAR